MARAGWPVAAQVRVQRTSERNIDELQPATDREDRHTDVESGRERGPLLLVAGAVDVPQQSVVTVASVQPGVDIAAATQNEAVEPRDEARQICQRGSAV